MGKEREMRILDIKKTEVVSRLKELGAKKVGRHHFKKVEFRTQGKVGSTHSWVRVRTDGKTTTLTFKELKDTGKVIPMKEYEVKTNDFAETVKIIGRLATSKIVYFETFRDAYSLGNTQITIDKWPDIPSFVEIESPSMTILKRTHKKLGISGKPMGNVPISKIYDNYGLDFLEVIKKNDEKVKRLLK